MIKQYLVVFFLFLGNLIGAQTLSGTIMNENKEPLEGVSVYFDGTTIGTTTSSNGTFEMQVAMLPKATLIVSYVGYETVYLSSITSPLVLQLKPAVIVLREVVMGPIPFSRKEMMQVFKEQFLGTTKGGKNSVILNEMAIQFAYDSQTHTLTAFADEKIRVLNNYLGYAIEFDLIDFFALYSKRTLSKHFLKRSYFAVTSFFKEIEPEAPAFQANRQAAYLGSTKHFFKNLIENQWGKDAFVLFEGSYSTNPDWHFEVLLADNLKLIQLKAKPITTHYPKASQFYKSFNLLFQNKAQSKVIFKTPQFYVDPFGNHTHIDQIDFSGEISKKRFGDMLPLDFISIPKRK